MHPVLQLENLSQAPSSYRGIASAAVNGRSQAMTNLGILSNRYTSDALTPPNHILPVVYATLDPILIPDIPRLDSVLSLPDSIIGRVFMSIGIVAKMLQRQQLPVGAYPDIWPRLFQWVVFMDTHRDSHPDLRMNPRDDLLTLFTIIMYQFSTHQPTVNLIHATPGFRTMLCRAWRFYVYSADLFCHMGTIALCDMINQDVGAEKPENFEELLLGVDGGIGELAALVVKHLNWVLACPAAQEEHLLVYLSAPMGLISQTADNVEFCSALLEQGIVTGITALIAHFASKPGATAMLTSCFIALTPKVQVIPAYPWIEEGLRAGLLRALVLAETHNPGSTLTESVGYFLRDGIARALVYFPVLVEVKRTLAAVKRLADTTAFQSSSMISHWREFVSVAEKHIGILNYHLSENRASFQICNNDECDKIPVKHATRRCSICRLAHYCSESCQHVDWRQGNHRGECKHLAFHRISDPEHLSARSRSFLCSLIQVEYINARSPFYVGEIGAMQDYPGEPYCFVFDYRQGHVGITLQLAKTLLTPPVPAKFAAQLVHQLGRAAKSGGRIQLAVIKISEGPILTARIIAIRHMDLPVHDTLTELARTIPVGLVHSDPASYAVPKVQPLLNRPMPFFSFASA